MVAMGRIIRGRERIRLWTGMLAACLMVPVLLADEDLFIEVDVDAGKVVSQQLYEDSNQACGPAAMINALRIGTPGMQNAFDALVGNDDRTRLRFTVDRYFKNKHSQVFPGVKRLGYKGVLAADLCNAFNDLMKENNLEAMAILELVRQEDENDRRFLDRVHKNLKWSLRRKVPPIIQLRAYAVMPEEGEDSKLVWKATGSHFVVLTRVPAILRSQDEGFVFDAVDPNGGRLISGYIFGEKHLPFRAEKGASSPTRGEWLSGRPFLLVKSPGLVSLQPRRASWKDRVIVTLSEAIGSF